jgi:soluble lytic murein transglycosylase
MTLLPLSFNMPCAVQQRWVSPSEMRDLSQIALPTAARANIRLMFYALAAALALTFGNGVAFGAAAATKPASSSLSAVEREWLAAREAFERRDLAALANAKQRFGKNRDFSLSPYVTWWWISAQLAQSAQNVRELNEEIAQLTAAYPDAPFSDQLRRDQLRALGKLDVWSTFDALQAGYQGDDGEVVCQRLRSRLLNQDGVALAAAVVDVKKLWAAAKPAAEPCYDAFSLLMVSKAISDDDAWRRVRTLFEANQLADARRSANLIPDLAKGFEAASASANLDPKRFLQSTPTLGSRAGNELALFAVSRWARSDADAAAKWLSTNSKRFDARTLAHAWAQIGFQGAQQLHPDALRWYANAGEFAFTDAQAAWLVRAALRATADDPSQWQTVRRAIAAMSESEQRDPAWRYWLARAKTTSSLAADQMAARVEREALARENHFYALMAAEELGITITPNFAGFVPAEAAIQSTAARSGVTRAFALYRLADARPELRELRNEALREWQFAIRGMDDETLLAAAEAARRQQLPDRAINTAERTRNVHDFAQRYPLPHRDLVEAQSKSFGLEQAWVYGLIRQESRFIADARSRAGALGLMQLMPATAKWAAKQVGVKDFTVARVIDVPVNLSLGSFYLRHVLDDLGNPVLATAAYNAGPGRARRWRAEGALEGAIYAESIPFNETRDYVKKVMLNKWYYLHRLNGSAPKLAELMGQIPGRSGATVARLPNVATGAGAVTGAVTSAVADKLAQQTYR